MNSYRRKLHPAKRDYVRLVGELHVQLEDAYSEENARDGVTKAEIAGRLNWHKSVITRIFNGQSNITLRTLAYLAWALGRRATIRLEPYGDSPGEGAGNRDTAEGHAAREDTPPRTPAVVNFDTSGPSQPSRLDKTAHVTVETEV
jgi:transcriptional regulator with XRE-family HTH domain